MFPATTTRRAIDSLVAALTQGEPPDSLTSKASPGNTQEKASGSLHPQSGEVPPGYPLVPGHYLWTVTIDGCTTRWELEYPYGLFPVSEPDALLWYRQRLYVLQRSWSSSLVVSVR